MTANCNNKPAIILIFGESENDRLALTHLVQAMRPNLPRAVTRRNPPILSRGAAAIKKKSNAERMSQVTKAQSKTHFVVSVIAHRDCDDVEPAHLNCSTELLTEMKACGLPQPVAATPAFEIEAWWMLWPTALRQTRPCWTALSTKGDVGAIGDAKEALTRELRSKNKACPDYKESDSPKIAELVKVKKLVFLKKGRSDSFSHFEKQIMGICI